MRMPLSEFYFNLVFTDFYVACSKRSDGGERCVLLPRFYFFALPFTLHRSPLSERLEQANFYGIAHEICTLSACHFQANLMKTWGQFNKTFTRVIYKCNHCFRV